VSDSAIDFDDDIPTGQLVRPALDDVPQEVLDHRVAIRQMRKRLTRIERIAWWIVATVGAGSVTVSLSVVTGAYYVGERTGGIEATVAEVARHDQRITHLEQKQMDRRGRDE
jgi:cell division protein FtsL